MKKQITTGDLNQHITIYVQQNITDNSGGTYPKDVAYWATSAKVDQPRASRQLQALQEKLKPAAVFTVRYRNDRFVTPDMRVKWREQFFTIVSAEPDFVNKEWLVIIGHAVQLPLQ